MSGNLERLRELRRARGLTQREVAEYLGISNAGYSLYELGHREPGIAILKKLTELYHLSIDELLGISKQPNTLAAHFDGNEYTPEELEEIRQFAEFVKSKRKDTDDHLQVNAAHERTDIEVTDEMRKHDEELMDDDNF